MRIPATSRARAGKNDAMKRSQLLGECSAEFFGTMILILFGVGVVAQVVTGGFPTTTGATGDYNSIAWGWGLGVAMAVFVAGRVSGAHLNPAVTVALAIFKGFSWRKIAPYIAAQMAGAFVGALLVRWSYSDAINRVDVTKKQTADQSWAQAVKEFNALG